MRSKPARDQFALHAGKPFARIASLLHRYHTEWLNELGILTKQARIKSDVVDLIFQATVPVTRSASIEFRHQVSKLTYEPSGPSDWRLSPVSMLRVKVFPLPLGWDASPSQCYHPASNSLVPIYTDQKGGKRRCESKVSCPKTQHNVPGQGSKSDPSIRETSALTI